MEHGMEYYREKIVEMIIKVDKIGVLEYLHTFISIFIEKWG